MGARTFQVDGRAFQATAAPPGLHVVATPIGNLKDITLRALYTLAGADHVAAEDTRHTGRLLAHYGIETALLRYDEHSAKTQRPRILAALAQGRSVALVSDAGTPLISDPGYRLVAEARNAGLAVHTVPGPSAVIAALSVCGLPTDSFMFAGFLPAKASQRRTRIASLQKVPATLVFYEAPHRLADTLSDLFDGLGGREAAVARELTKRFETVERGTLDVLAARLGAAPPKGEIVIVIAPPEDEVRDVSDAEVERLLLEALAQMPVSAAAGAVARETGRDRRALYRQAVALKAAR
ncbi:MAG: 16S rRNA (cytidine(1402)-2'-O)-methyltransferase [Pseudomonadota bacterium]